MRPAPGPLRPPTAAARAAAVDDVCVELARHLDDPRDVEHLEQAMGRPIAGLWGALGDGRLRGLLEPEIGHRRRLAGHRRSHATLLPDAEVRALAQQGFAENDLAAMADGRVRVLHARLASATFRNVPLLQQVEDEALRRQELALVQLRRLWHRHLTLCHRAAAAPQAQAVWAAWRQHADDTLAADAASWTQAAAWLPEDPASASLQAQAARYFAALRAAVEHGAPPPSWPLTEACLRELDDVCRTLQLLAPATSTFAVAFALP